MSWSIVIYSVIQKINFYFTHFIIIFSQSHTKIEDLWNAYKPTTKRGGEELNDIIFALMFPAMHNFVRLNRQIAKSK